MVSFSLLSTLATTAFVGIGLATPQTGPPVISIVNRLHPNGVANKCLVVQNNNNFNGAPVVLGDCNDSAWWTLNQADTLVRLGATEFCLDAGSTPGNGVAMKIWQCYDTSLQAQHWYYTTDQRIALAGQGLCLDLDSGDLADGTKVQTWTCTDFNTNQVWTE